MAASRLLLFSIFLTLIFAKITAEVETNEEDALEPQSPLKIELEQLNSKISLLDDKVLRVNGVWQRLMVAWCGLEEEDEEEMSKRRGLPLHKRC
ncbi:hypothetical protein Acr_20g0004560 [Actinidia rufa]|uniref:Uncharacterized protein n=1 Tax=Actinidia rufa TaxID=165716 RepID=A0A7J0GD83_9ERIC|nr:hypothetical protein Acr_20g0004560 [Actinidia rufa]